MTETAESLLQFLTPDETAAQLLKRVAVEPLLTGVPFFDGRTRLRPNHLALISGCTGSGKTELLIQTAATCILPKQWQGYEIGGLEGSCMFIDLDFKFDLLRLWTVLRCRLEPRLGNDTNGIQGQQLVTAVEAVIHESLPRLHLVQCQSSFEFLATLKVMPLLLQRLENAGAAKMLLIDNIAANIQLDRMSRGGPGAVMGVQQVGDAVITHLQDVLASRVAVIAAQHVLPPRAQDSVALAREVTPTPWQKILTQHVFTFVLRGGDPTKPVVYAAQWLLPHHDGEDRFEISEGSIVASS